MFYGLIYLLEGFFLTGYLTGGNSFPMPLSAEEERDYLYAYANGCEDAKNILIERNLRLVAHMAKRYGNHAKDAEDLISIGTIGLIKAIASYNADKGVRLATYAARCIDNEILMHIRTSKKYAKDVYLQDIVGVDREGNEVRIEDKIADYTDAVEDQVGTKMEMRKVISAVRKVLHGREKDVIKMRYGLDGSEELTQREISDMLRISRSYVSRIEKKALEKLKIVMQECFAS